VTAAAPCRPRIGVFDSGLGGLSVLAALRARLPDAALHYIADSAWAPYGERGDGDIAARSLHLAHRLRDEGAQALVVACNTATAVAVDALRAAMPGVPIVGVEPGLKPALAATRNGRVAVMATTATVRSPRMQALVARLAPPDGGTHVHLQACDGLAAAIESGDARALQAAVARHGAAVQASGADTVALGCTHYVFALDAIQAALGPGVVLVDTAQAVARRVADVCGVAAGTGTANPVGAAAGDIRLQSTGDPALLRRFAQRSLGGDRPVTAL